MAHFDFKTACPETVVVVHVTGLPFTFVIVQVMVPCGSPMPGAVAATVALKFTALPAGKGSCDSFRVKVVVAALTTVSVSGAASEDENPDEPE
jgi:hypothetical protein